MNLMIAVKSCEAHRDRELAQLDTWGKQAAIQIQFFTGPDLGVSDDYLSLPAKTKAICEWLVDEDVDFSFLADTDTYISISRLIGSGFEKYDYSGYVKKHGNPPYAFGPGYWLSKRAISILAAADWSKCHVPEYPDAEDVLVGAVLATYGSIFPHHDPRYALFEPVLPGNDIISSHLSNGSTLKFTIDMMYSAHRAATNG